MKFDFKAFIAKLKSVKVGKPDFSRIRNIFRKKGAADQPAKPLSGLGIVAAPPGADAGADDKTALTDTNLAAESQQNQPGDDAGISLEENKKKKFSLDSLKEVTGKINLKNMKGVTGKINIDSLKEFAANIKKPNMKFSIGQVKVWLAKFRAKLQDGSLAAGLANLPKSVQAEGGDIWTWIDRNKVLINCSVIVVCSLMLANLIASLTLPFIPNTPMTRPPEVSRNKQVTLAKYNRIYTRNLFNEKGLIPDPSVPVHDPNAPAVKTSLPLNLLGTIILKDEIKSIASIEDRGQRAVIAVRVNEPLSKDTVVTRIEKSKVTFYNKKTARNEYIDIPQKKTQLRTTGRTAPKSSSSRGGNGVTFVSETEVKIDRSAVDKALANFSKVLTDARCVPNMQNGRPFGFKCFQIVPGSIYDQLGLKNNDVICEINGEPLNNPAQAMSMFQKLQSARKIELCIVTNGKRRDVTYEIQ